LKRGEKSARYEKITKPFILKRADKNLELVNLKNDVFLFHLHLIQTLDTAIKTELFTFHFVLLRQLLENISSFLGVGRTSYTLEQIGIENASDIGDIINSLSHKNIYTHQFHKLNESEEKIFTEVFRKILEKYQFIF
jgi:hypothetical protein